MTKAVSGFIGVLLISLVLWTCHEEPTGYDYECCLDGVLSTCHCDGDGICDPAPYEDCGNGFCELTADGGRCRGLPSDGDGDVDTDTDADEDSDGDSAGAFECCVDGHITRCSCPDGAPCDPASFEDCGDGTCAETLAGETCSEGEDAGVDSDVELDSEGSTDGDVAFGEGDTCDPASDRCGEGLTCCYPCGVMGCDYVCEPTCDPDEPGCSGGCLLRA